MIGLYCCARRHRPMISLGEGFYVCRCGLRFWRMDGGLMVVPGAGLLTGYRVVHPDEIAHRLADEPEPVNEGAAWMRTWRRRGR